MNVELIKDKRIDLNEYRNFHDAVITKISFLKDREMDPVDGSIIFNYKSDVRHKTSNLSSLCTIEIEILHSNYHGKLSNNDRFKIILSNATEFTFRQNERDDYSIVYNISIDEEGSVRCFINRETEILVTKCQNLEIVRISEI